MAPMRKSRRETRGWTGGTGAVTGPGAGGVGEVIAVEDPMGVLNVFTEGEMKPHAASRARGQRIIVTTRRATGMLRVARRVKGSTRSAGSVLGVISPASESRPQT